MIYTWSLGIDLPQKLPVAFAYKMILDTLNTKTTIVNSGQMSFDFCCGCATDCGYKEYCPCLEYWNNPIDVDVLSFPDDDDTNSKQIYGRDSPPDDFESYTPL